MKRKEYLIDRLEELKFKHSLLDNWIKELKFDSQKTKEKKIDKLRMKEEIEQIKQELQKL